MSEDHAPHPRHSSGSDEAPSARGASGPVATRTDVLALAVPAFFALVAEPLFLLADSAIIGHLGTAHLAGLGAASAVLASAASVFVFLAYGTTSVVARQVGAGHTREAIGDGIDGLWLALLLGIVSAIVVAWAAPGLVGIFSVSPEAAAYATTYLRISALGLPALLAGLAVTGVLRGLQDTRTPLIASVAGFTANIALNLALVYGAGLGIAGSAWGTVIAQNAMAAGLVAVVLRQGWRHGAAMRPHSGRVLRAARAGVPLLVRTLALRAVILTSTWIAAGLGDVPLAAYQVSATIWTFLAFVVDALAIAAQALTGKALGAGDIPAVRAATALMVRWGIGVGIVLGLVVAAASPVLPRLFTSDPAVQATLTAALLVVAAMQPVAAHAFVLDGVLIGAGDGRWLAGAQTALLVLFLPGAAAVYLSRAQLLEIGTGVAVAALWGAMTVFMALRALALHLRSRTSYWLVTGTA